MDTTINGDGRFISKLASWLVWREFTNNWKTVEELAGSKHPSKTTMVRKMRAFKGFDEEGPCPICGGWEETTLDGQKVYCICRVLEWQAEVDMRQSEFFAKPRLVQLGDLMAYGDPQAKNKLKNFFSEIKDWIKDPTHWLVISGPVGTGKSHAMQALTHMMSPMALYLPAAEFESKIYAWLSQGVLEEALEVIRKAPFLFFDDWGAEYGSDLPKAKLREVIDFRYQHPREYVTVVSTNLPVSVLLANAVMGDRIASRIQDVAISRVIDLNGVPDYRLKVR